MRLFVALHLDDLVRDRLARVPVPGSTAGSRVRRVKPHNLHVTLKFLGDVEDARIPAVITALKNASSQVRPFDLAVAALGTFGPRKAPRVLVAGCDGGKDLVILHARIEQELEPLGFETEPRQFRPHVTLARTDERKRRHGEGLRPIEVLLNRPDWSEETFGTVRIDSISLVSSLLGAGGARYENVAIASLAGGQEE